jgi:hypothetical protein
LVLGDELLPDDGVDAVALSLDSMPLLPMPELASEFIEPAPDWPLAWPDWPD